MAALTTDQQLTIWIAALAQVGGLAVGLIVSGATRWSERRHWLRQERLEAYVGLLRAHLRVRDALLQFTISNRFQGGGGVSEAPKYLASLDAWEHAREHAQVVGSSKFRNAAEKLSPVMSRLFEIATEGFAGETTQDEMIAELTTLGDGEIEALREIARKEFGA